MRAGRTRSGEDPMKLISRTPYFDSLAEAEDTMTDEQYEIFLFVVEAANKLFDADTEHDAYDDAVRQGMEDHGVSLDEIEGWTPPYLG
ncbi:hypothetical protein SEA_WOOPER_72 [Gordonia phage Wooper]|nr:hypothetical protein SEA_WOOPER_72 [Gordonia phage Wooper]